MIEKSGNRHMLSGCLRQPGDGILETILERTWVPS